ncbi:ATP-binding protein [Phaeobacter porticola]|uniref:Putative serine-protein kinase (Anti-sigma-B factor) n=1 Tax=Phaeobacter porticola TaxID=1844006 RepID=A0A1L3I8Z9_9RHOB|nr:ATP-binding protein [Phaeobacter porticola]APG48588.1 putative serine-protein kinase (anti-sigma-B factor) [Phaeobacter porticola]
MVETFSCSFIATELEARSGVQDVIAQLRTMGISDSRVDEVQIALTEAVNNVVEHAYAGMDIGDVRIRCNLHPDQLWISIGDGGAPFKDGKLPVATAHDLTVETDKLPEGGFGWLLIRELASDVQYKRDATGNNLSLCFEIKMRNAKPD